MDGWVEFLVPTIMAYSSPSESWRPTAGRQSPAWSLVKGPALWGGAGTHHLLCIGLASCTELHGRACGPTPAA